MESDCLIAIELIKKSNVNLSSSTLIRKFNEVARHMQMVNFQCSKKRSENGQAHELATRGLRKEEEKYLEKQPSLAFSAKEKKDG
ncbi:hypothetical protein J1N35_001934 [Gossypium stocksii]|uniref:RNase H type-1 domain-containing protein n=1 Tax=Gossypium stocksii TaxID=47602 RepID=A0A9D3WKE4_9ROSI|nr:hypothetical protein J1N35_001934 [Gossypium stocksii]